MEDLIEKIIKSEHIEKQKLTSLESNHIFYQEKENCFNYINNNFPCSKCLIFYTNDFSAEIIEIYNKNLKKLQINTQVIKIENKGIYSISDFYPFINSLEDIRFILVFENTLLQVAKYLGTIKSSSVIFVTDYYNLENVFLNTIYLKSNETNFFENKCSVNVFITNLLNLQNSFKLYCFVMCNLIVLTDYRINCFYKNKKINVVAYNLLKEAVEKCYKIFTETKDNQKQILIDCALMVNAAYLISEGDLENSSSVNAILLANKFLNNFESFDINILFNLIDLYKLALNENFDKNLIFHNCYLDCIFINQRSEINFNDISKKAICKSNIYKAKVENSKIFNKKLFNELNAQSKSKNKILLTYNALGGEKLNKQLNLKEILSLAEYFSDFNGLSLLKEKGYLD